MKKRLRIAAFGLLTCCMVLGSGIAVAQDGLVLQLRADSYNDSTGIWADTSGQGRDMYQWNPADIVRPTKVSGQTPNGNSVVRFDQSDNMNLAGEDLILPANIYLDAAQTQLNPESGVTYIAYVRRDADTDPAEHRWLLSGNYYGSPTWIFRRNGTQFGYQNGGGRLGYSLTENNDFGCYSFSLDRTGGEMRLNGVFDGEVLSVDTILNGEPGPAWNYITTLGHGSMGTFRGDIAEIRIYNRKLTQSEIETVEAELCAAYEEDPNTAPIAVAGADQSIHAGDDVFHDGSTSFDDNTASTLLGYAWSITSQPAGSTAQLLDAYTATPSFVADLTGDYVVELTVTDEGGLQATDAVVISSNNQAPTAVANTTDTLAFVGCVVTLDGSDSSDPDGDDITYSWTITAAPAGSTAQLVGANSASPTFTPDLEGDYEFSLEVSDFLGPGLPATVEFTATTAASFAESLILDASDIVAGLNSGQVTTKGNQNAFQKHLANAVKDLQAGETTDAIDKLNKAIERTDGCPLRGAPDGNGNGRDWITDCDAQQVIYDLLTLAVETLE